MYYDFLVDLDLDQLNKCLLSSNFHFFRLLFLPQGNVIRKISELRWLITFLKLKILRISKI